MLVISDTGPLRYLIEVDAVDALPELFQQVLTTPQVIDELGLEHFPSIVRDWARNPPDWLGVTSPETLLFLDVLHEGEASALSLARERAADLVLIDDRDGSDVAHDVGLQTMGTLGVLREAGAQGRIDFETALQRLTQTRFRYTPELIEEARRQYYSLLADLRLLRERDQKQESQPRDPGKAS